MAAKIRERRGDWWVFANHQGQRRAKQVGPGKAGKKLADALSKQWNAALVLGDVDRVFPPKTKVVAQGALPTLRVALPAWIEQQERSKELRGASALAYLSAARTWLYPALGDLPVDAITREQIGAAIRAARDAGRSRSTVNMMIKAARGLFTDLVETKQLAVSPAADLSHFTKKMPKAKSVEIFSKAECLQILRAAEGSRLHPFVAVALSTGARWGELSALVKDDVDLKAGRLHVHASWSRNTGHVTDTKTSKSRFVPITRDLAGILRSWLETRTAEGWGEQQLLFPGTGNRHIKAWHATWGALLKRAKVGYKNFHVCRHSFASYALKSGTRPELVSKWLGHSSLVLTLTVYAAFVPDHESDARDAERLSDLIC